MRFYFWLLHLSLGNWLVLTPLINYWFFIPFYVNLRNIGVVSWHYYLFWYFGIWLFLLLLGIKIRLWNWLLISHSLPYIYWKFLSHLCRSSINNGMCLSSAICYLTNPCDVLFRSYLFFIYLSQNILRMLLFLNPNLFSFSILLLDSLLVSLFLLDLSFPFFLKLFKLLYLFLFFFLLVL